MAYTTASRALNIHKGYNQPLNRNACGPSLSLLSAVATMANNRNLNKRCDTRTDTIFFDVSCFGGY